VTSLHIEGVEVAESDPRPTLLPDGSKVWIDRGRFFAQAAVVPRGVSLVNGQLEVAYQRSVLSRWVMGLPPRDFRALGDTADMHLVDGVVDSPPIAGKARQALALARKLQPPLVVALEMALDRIDEGDSSLGIRQFTTLLEALEQQDNRTPISAEQRARLLRLTRRLETKAMDRWLGSESAKSALGLILASPQLQPPRIAAHLEKLPRDDLADAVFNAVPKASLAAVLPLLASTVALHPPDILVPRARRLDREASADLVVVAADLAKQCGSAPPKELAESFRRAVREQQPEVAIVVIDTCLALRVSLPPEPVRAALYTTIATVDSADRLAASAAKCLLDDQMAGMRDDVVFALLREVQVETLPRVVSLLLERPTKKHGSILSARAKTAESTQGGRETAMRIKQVLEGVDPRRAARDYASLLDGNEQAVIDALEGLRRVGDLPELDAVRRRKRGLLTSRAVRELARVVEEVILRREGMSGRLGLASDSGDLSFARDEGALSTTAEPVSPGKRVAPGSAETVLARILRMFGREK
jgi:hypothetical protein